MSKVKTHIEAPEQESSSPQVTELEPHAPQKTSERTPAAPQKLSSKGAVSRARTVSSLQRSVGNARLSHMLNTNVQAMPEISKPDDPSEHEADHVADTVMRMSERKEGESQTASVEPGAQLDAGRGGGQPLSKSQRDFMEPRFGRTFENVRLHTDQQAQQEAAGIGAKAFTQGADISFGAGSSPDDQKLLAHELTHVAQQDFDGAQGLQGIATQPSAKQVMRAPGPLTAAQEAAARTFMNSRYDERSIRIVQLIVGTNVDGRFGDISAQAVATHQGANGLAVDGQVGPNTLNQMVANRVAAGRQEHAIQLVVDFHNLNVRSDTLTIHFDATLGAVVGTTTFGPGNLRVITLGPLAFASEPALLAAITAQLTAAAPAVPALGPRPALLTGAQEVSATSFNRDHFSDRRSVLAIQGHVGANPDAIFGRDTVQRIADAQRVAGLVVDGRVGRATLELFTTELIAAGQQDAAIRLIIDFFNFRDNGNLLDVFFDPTEVDNAATDFRPNEPVRIAVGPSGVAQPFAGLVHTIAHEFEHVRRLREGIVAAATHEFLGEAIEILSVGTPEEALENVAPGAPGFVGGFANDADRAVTNWNLMPLADRRRFRERFIAVRARVRARVAAGTPAQQALHAPLVATYNAVVVPAP